MYRRPKFLEILLEIRPEMARDADYDVDLFVEMVRSGKGIQKGKTHSLVEPGSESGKTASDDVPRRDKRKTAQKI
jgi:hypothetical protein